jgi:hypothetical protein
LRTAPAKKLRTECWCHPVAFMIAAMVAPCGRRNSATISSCFESEPTFGATDLVTRNFDFCCLVAYDLIVALLRVPSLTADSVASARIAFRLALVMMNAIGPCCSSPRHTVCKGRARTSSISSTLSSGANNFAGCVAVRFGCQFKVRSSRRHAAASDPSHLKRLSASSASCPIWRLSGREFPRVRTATHTFFARSGLPDFS